MKNRVLLDGCKWLLDGLSFDSDQELDVYIQQQLNNGIYTVDSDNLVISQSVDLQQKTIEIIEKAKSEVEGVARKVTPKLTDVKSYTEHLNNGASFEDAEELESYYIIDGSIGVNKLLRLYVPDESSKPLVQPFDENKWRETTAKALKDENPSLSDAEVLEIVDNIQNTWPQLSEIGTDIHSIAENVFNGTPVTKGRDSHFSDEQFNNIKRDLENLKRTIEAKYPGCKFYTELGIIDKTLSPRALATLGDDINSVNGKIDLLVIDKEGIAHIYDFKVSRHEVGEWENGEYLDPEAFKKNVSVRKRNKLWDIGKIRAASYQLALYSEILRQKGIEVYDANIIPIKIDLTYTDSEHEAGIKTIENIHVQDVKTNLPGVIFGNYAQRVKGIIVQQVNPDNEQVLKWADIFNQFFPKNTTLLQREEKRANVETYLNDSRYTTELRPGQQPKWQPNARYKFYNRNVKKFGTYSYFNTKEELIEHINNYIGSLQESASEFGKALGRTIKMILKGDESPEKIGEIFKEVAWARNRFKRYFTEPGWSLDSNEQLLSNGILIFTNGNKCELIVLENQNLEYIQNLGMGTSLLGKNTQNKYVNRAKTLDASNANLALMKAMIFIANNQDAFSNRKITQISVMNTGGGQEISHLPSRLIDNYNDLCRKNPNVDTPLIMHNIFSTDSESCISIANSLLRSVETDINGLTQLDTEANSLEEIEHMIDELKVKYPELRTNRNFKNADLSGDPIWQAYWYLEQARLSFKHNYITSETESGKWFNKGFKLNGYMIASPQYSSSADIRQLGALLQNYENEVAREIMKKGLKMQHLFEKLYKEYGNGTQAFKEWFVRNPDGTLDERFILKDPDSPEFKGSAVSKEALREFLRAVAELKRPNLTEADVEQMKEDGTYYMVPLTEAVWSRELKGNIRNDGFINGIIKTIRHKWQQAATLTKNVFAEDEVQALEENESGERLYNKFDLTGDSRQAKINDRGIGSFETNLEIVFNQVLVAYSRVKVAEDYIPRIQAMRLGLMYAQDHGGIHNERIQEAFDKIVKSKFYGENIIEDKHLQAVFKWLSFIRSIFTTMTLSINIPSFLRESLQGIYTGVSRSFVEIMPGIDKNTYAKGLAYVIQQSHKNFSSTSLLQQLNAQYQMANQSVNQIANQRRLNWGNIKNWNKDTLFLTATAPDFMHRVAILVSKMMGDNCWEAHSLNENGELVYDFKKDKRFEQLIAGNTSHPDYLKQKSLYERMIEEFNKDGYRNPDGTELNIERMDALPRAYTDTENRSIKNYADLLYGHYDDASRALVNDTFVGSFALQYKTYITAKFEQWTMPQGIYNTEMLKQQYDPVTGEELYMKISYDENGRPQRDIVRKSQITQEDIDSGNARVYYDYEGIPMEGLLAETWNFTKSLAKMDFKTFRELWNNPTDRGFFLIALHDQLFMALLMMLATYIFGSANDVEHPWNIAEVSKQMRKSGPGAQMLWNVIEGSTVDAQFIGLAGGNSGVLQSMAANPALLTAFKRFSTSNWNMITGKQSFVYTASQNIGAIRSFQGLIKNLEDED